ncbi:MAG: transporter [Planctomycetes bacterium]|nr:transporter [Planctomycetota bacterium]
MIPNFHNQAARYLWALAVLFVAGQADAQVFRRPAQPEEVAKRDDFETDRDSFTFATSTAAVKTTIVESSYSYIDNRVGPSSHSYPELLVRHGITDWLELRVGWNYEQGGPGAVSGNEVGGEDLQAETEGRLLYGAKVWLTRQDGLRPNSSFIVQGYTPTAGPSTASTIDVGQAFGWKFSNGWSWNSALRYANGYEGDSVFGQWAPSTVLDIPLGQRWRAHAEYFAIISSGKQVPLNEHFASFGAHVMLTPNIEFGDRFGVGLNDVTPGFFNNIGLGWRF